MNDNTLHGRLTASGNLTGTVNTIVYAHNYNDLSNKPSINSITLQGNKTASELGLATPSDIPVTSVNEQTGDVELTGDNIPYDTLTSVNAKINDLESQIVGAGVQSVNGMTGNVTLTGANINYSVGVSLNSRIDAVEGEIPVINYPVTSVNGKTGAVSLAGSDIEYSAGVSLTDQIDNISGEISDLTGADIPMTALDSTKVATAIGSLSSLTTTNKDSLVDAVNEVDGKKSDKVANGTYNFSGIWSPSFYSSRSMFIPFPNANDYTVTLVRARYASDNTTMNDITSTAQIPTGGVSEVGIQVSTTSNCDLKYGDIQLKFE